MPEDPIPDQELFRRASDGPANALPLRHSPEPVNCTTVLDGIRRFPHRPPEHVRAPGYARSCLACSISPARAT
ncbi:hypothetical protein AB0J90_18170 [Micromonospora sp. NPDC049523]|uniref:hypothetical protein n=1 Tax=Micromonospora sp. NPDC049523 TaxID=3155921 RepID=UPI003429EBE3